MSGEMQEAIETNDSGAIFITKPSSSSSPPRSKRALASADSLALDPKRAHQDGDGVDDDMTRIHQRDGGDSQTQEDDLVSLELLTVVDDKPEKNRLHQLCSRRMIWCWLCALVLVILAIVFPLTMRNKQDNTNISTGDNGGIDFVSDGSVTTPAYEVLRPIVADPDALLDPKTAEGQAYLAVRKENDPFDIQQNYALQVLYHSTDGEAWVFNHGWGSYANPTRSSQSSLCGWASISVCRSLGDGHMAVASLDLDSNNLRGSLPEDLCLLSNLEALRVANNQLEGTLPSCLAAIPSLEVIEVEGNTKLSEDAVSDPLFCENDRLWDSFVTDCVLECECCTACV
jgi:hypothetical protein